jgi:anthranilate/para-aminobenzoate synthase component II
MSGKILIVDFDDSFTYNIANILFPFVSECKIISHQDFFSHKYFSFEKNTGLILGPGPGHPDQYVKYFPTIKKLMADKNIYLMGICLGHQLLNLVNGKNITKSQSPMHGQSVAVNFSGNTYWVQRYNSLVVIEDDIEVDISRYHNGVSYQFHPESVGTDDNIIFFHELINYVNAK